MTCYEISQEYEELKAILNILENNEDVSEMEQALHSQLETLNHTTESKLENMSKMIRNMELESSAYKQEIDRMTKKMKSINSQVDYIKNDLIKPILEKTGKINAGVFTVSLRKSQSVNIVDEDLIDDKYKNVSVVTKVDKAEIKKCLKTGEVKGAELVTNQSVQIK